MAQPQPIQVSPRLTPAMNQQLKNAEAALLALLPEMDKMQEVGINVDGYRAAARDMIEKSTKMRQHFGS